MESASEVSPAVAGLAAAVEGSLDGMVSSAVETIWAQVAAYSSSTDAGLRGDVVVHVRAVFSVFLRGLGSGQQARRADFALTREHAMRRVMQGISLADFLQAFRIGQLTLWQGVLAAARGDPAAQRAALSLVAQIMQVIELGSTVAGEAYIQAQPQLAVASYAAAPTAPRIAWRSLAAALVVEVLRRQ